MDQLSCGYPDLSCHGREAWRPDLSGHSHMLGMLFCGLYEGKDQPFIYVAFNMNWTPQELALPDLPDGYSWKLVLDTDDRGMKPVSKPKAGTKAKETEPENNVFTELLADRSTRIYMSVQDKKKTKKKVTGKKNK